MPPTVVGLFTGLLLGLAWVIGGFDAFVGTAVLGVLGFLIGKVVAGQLDLIPYPGGRGRGSRGAPPSSPGSTPGRPGYRWPPRPAARIRSSGIPPTGAA